MKYFVGKLIFISSTNLVFSKQQFLAVQYIPVW